MFIGGVAIGLIALVALELIVLLSLVVWERPYSGFLSLLATIGLTDIFFHTGIFTAIWHQPLIAVGLVAAYVGAGVAWSFPKWWFYVRRIRDQYTESLTKYKKAHKIDAVQVLDPSQVHQFYHTGQYGLHTDDGEFLSWGTVMPVQASKNKNKILVWMMYWPFSLVWTLIDEPFKRAFYFIFERIKGIYQGISERAFAGVEVYETKR